MIEDRKYLQKLLSTPGKYDVERYREPDFKKTHGTFTGTPRKHPSDKTRVILMKEPFQTGSSMYEFALSSIVFIEEVETITNEEGKSAPVVRLWVKKGEVAHKIEPFIV